MAVLACVSGNEAEKVGDKARVLLCNLANYAMPPIVPPLQGPAVFECLRIGELVQGERQLSHNGFFMQLSIRARVRAGSKHKSELLDIDLESIELAYRDDLLEVQDVSERDIPSLLESLYKPENRARHEMSLIPGGEVIAFSPPMRKLLFLGAKARPAVEAKLRDPHINNEITLLLGAIGDEWAIPRIIEGLPEGQAQEGTAARKGKYWQLTCGNFALAYLTGQEIGRDRTGMDPEADQKMLWTNWWRGQGTTFRLPSVKPSGTWVPRYPALTGADYARKAFIRRIGSKESDLW